MSIKDKIKNAKESNLFDELSEKEKLEAILEARLKVRLIAELEEIKAEINAKERVEFSTGEIWYNFALADVTHIIDNHTKELEEK